MADEATKSIPKTPKTPKSEVDSAKKSAQKPIKSAKKMAPSAVPQDSEPETNGWDHDEQNPSDEEEAAQTRSEAPDVEDDGEEEAEDELTERDPTETVGDTATHAGATAEESAEGATEDVVPVGHVSESGDVVDDDGDVIGKVSGEEAEKLAGNIVDEEGNIRDEDGKIVGSAEPNEAGSVAESTAEEAKDDTAEKTDDVKGKVDEGVAGLDSPKLETEKGDELEKSKDGLDIDEKAKNATEEVGEKTAESKDSLGASSSKEDLDEKLKDTTDGVGEASKTKDNVDVDESKEDVDEKAEGATEKLGETAEGAKDDVDVDTEDKVKGIEDLPKDGIDVEESAEKAKEGADIGEEKDDLESKVDETGSQVKDVAEDLEMPELQGPFKVDEEGVVTDANEQKVGDLAEGVNAEDFEGKDVQDINAEGELLGEHGTVLGQVELLPIDELPKPELPDISTLKGLKVNKLGNVVDADGNPVGKLVEGEPKKLAGKEVDEEGKIWDNAGKVIGRCETIPAVKETSDAPFEDFPDSIVDKSGKVLFEDKQVGIIVEGDIKKMIGKRVDADGDVLDRHGNTLGRAERQDEEEPEEPEPEPEAPVDYSLLVDKKVNKAGNVCDDKGRVVGRVKEGVLKALIGKVVDKDGNIWNTAGKVIGKAEPIPEDEREDFAEPSPFEDFPDALVEKSGNVVYEGKVIGKLIEGDAKKLAGKKVDADGDVVDKSGNVLGKAERWEEDEPEPEAEIDMSILAGKRCNKLGNICDSHGEIYGRVIEGDVKRLAGKMCDKKGFLRNEGGDVIGKAELIPEAEREGLKEGPFTDFPGCTVAKNGTIVTPSGEVVGRLVSGDGKVLFGRSVDEDGEVLDRNGNTLGKAERWEEEEVAKDINPMSGRKVNKEGNVVDENGDIIGKLTDGSLQACAGKKIDDDGDVVDGKGKTVGHVTLLEDIPEEVKEEEPQESEEDRKKREQLEVDKKLAGQMASCIEQSLDKIKPILKMITDAIDKAERTPKEELDEEELVKKVKPLIEEGGRILTESNGVIRGLDPDGRISANAKHKTAAREASPEEYRLADLLKELTGHVTTTIDNAKKKIDDMPHAKKELNPLWGLLSEPLFQILAAVGLLLSGVLGLVGKLLSGLGLGGLVDSLLGGLGLTRLLDGLGLGSIVGSMTGKNKGGQKKGLLG